MTVNSERTMSLTQYGVQTPHGTVLTVTTDPQVAQDALEWIAGGQVVARTLIIGPWHPQVMPQRDRWEQTG